MNAPVPDVEHAERDRRITLQSLDRLAPTFAFREIRIFR